MVASPASADFSHAAEIGTDRRVVSKADDLGEPRKRIAAIGRFQPFHWGHFEYVLESGRLGDSLLIGVTNPSRQQIRYSVTDARGYGEESNPFTYEERRSMISCTLARLAPHLEFTVVPCDLRSPTLLRQSLGVCDVVALSIYDEWGLEKQSVVEAAGYATTVLWRRVEKIVSGTEVRERLRSGRPWDHLVPSGTAEVLASRAEGPRAGG